jgi:hypothetical protein
MENFEAAHEQMPEYFKVMYLDLKAKLAENRLSAHDFVLGVTTNITTIRTYISQLKEYVSKHEFEDEAAEIFFFKFTKPLFYAELMFYIDLLTLETEKPLNSVEGDKRYYLATMQKLVNHYAENQPLYVYMRSGDDSQDQLLFLRKSYHPLYTKESYYIDADPAFYTHGDFKVARILAYDKMQYYLIGVIENKANPYPSNNLGELTNELIWADSKTDAVELIYALHAKGSISRTKGKVTIKELVTLFEFIYRTDLGNYYETRQQILRRKKEPTPYLDGLKDAFLKSGEPTD